MAERCFWYRPAGEDREACGGRAGQRGAAALGHTRIGRFRVVKYPAHERLTALVQTRRRLQSRRVAGIFHQPGTGAPRAWSRGAAVGTALLRAFARDRLASRRPWRRRRGVSLLLTLMLILRLAVRGATLRLCAC